MAKKTTTKKNLRITKPKTSKLKKEGYSGLSIPMTLSGDLADFMGTSKASRAEITKEIWKHIKKHGLQDKESKRLINPDEALEPILGSKQLSMFSIATKISEHVS